MHSCILVIFVCFVLVAINKCRMPTNLLSMLSMFSPPDDLTDAHVWFSWFILHFCWVCKVVVTLALAIFFSYLGLLGLFGHTRHLGHPGQPFISDILALVTLLYFFSHDDLHMLVNLLCLVVMSRNPIADALVWLSYFSPAVILGLGTLRNIWTSAKSDYDTTSYVLGFSKMWK